MRFLPCVIPTASRVHTDLDRYIRSEYRESSSSWFAANCKENACVKILAEEPAIPAMVISSSIPETASSASPRPTNCPVLNAIADSRLLKELTTE